MLPADPPVANQFTRKLFTAWSNRALEQFPRGTQNEVEKQSQQLVSAALGRNCGGGNQEGSGGGSSTKTGNSGRKGRGQVQAGFSQKMENFRTLAKMDVPEA